MSPPTHAATRTAFHHPSVFGPVVAATLVVTAVAWMIGPDIGWWSAGVVLVVVALLGIPHGSLDHMVAFRLAGDRAGVRTVRRRFVRDYLLLMAAAGLVWLVAPPVALAGFLAVSVHHFGQSDLAHLGLTGRRRLAVQWSRGLFLVALPLVVHLSTIAPLVERLGGGDPAEWTWLAERSGLLAALLVGQHVVVGAIAARDIDDIGVLRREALSVAVLTALFVFADPLVGFAVYFGLWHSTAHLLVLGNVLDGVSPTPMRPIAQLLRTARRAAPLTALSLAGLGAVVIALVVAGRGDAVLPAVFVAVSVLTVPHMVVVERLWRHVPPAWAAPSDRRGRSVPSKQSRSPIGSPDIA